MKIVIRDECGYVIHDVWEEYGIELCDGYVYWADGDNVDQKTPIENVVRIGTGNTYDFEGGF